MTIEWGSVFIKGGNQSKHLKLQSYRGGQRLPVFQASFLLSSKQHQFFLSQLKELAALPDEHYRALYEPLVNQFAEFVQVLPSQPSGALCDLMNEGLLRGMNALRLLVQSHQDVTLLERYAVFSAALLSDVSKVVINQKLFLTDDEGAFVKEWQPMSGTVCEEESQYYKIMWLAPTFQRIAHTLTPLLARQLMPVVGFDWIASEPLVFIDWLAALRDEEGGGVGRLSHVTQLVKRPAEEGDGFAESLPAVPVTLEDSPATEHADAFMEWLKNGIADKTIKVNTPDASVHVVDGGVFIEKAGVFRQFADYYGQATVNYFSVFQQFGNLFGLTKLSGQDYRNEQYFSEYPTPQQTTGNLFGAKVPKEVVQERQSDVKAPAQKQTKDMFGVVQNKLSDVLSGKGKSHSASVVTQQNAIKEGVLISDVRLVFASADVPSPTPLLTPKSQTQKSALPSLPQQFVAPRNEVK